MVRKNDNTLQVTKHIILLFTVLFTAIVSGIFIESYFINKHPKISVVMPVYNTEKYLKESIEGVLNQTFKDFEFIIIDDGSTDNSLQIIKQYAKTDSRIKVVALKQNKGAGEARNEGIKHITGKYTLFIDSDDKILPQMLEKLYNHALKYNLDITMCLAHMFNDKLKKYYAFSIVDDRVSYRYKFLKMHHITSFSHKTFPKVFFQLSRNYLWDKLIKTSIIKNNNLYFDNVSHHNDSLFVTMAKLHAKRIGYITDRLYIYKNNRIGSISSNNPDDMESVYKTFQKIKKNLQKLGLYAKLKNSYLSWVGSFIPSEGALKDPTNLEYRDKLITLRFGNLDKKD